VAWCLVAWKEALDSTFSLALASRHVTAHEKSTRASLTQGATYEEKKRQFSKKYNHVTSHLSAIYYLLWGKLSFV